MSSSAKIESIFDAGINLGVPQRFELREELSSHQVVMIDFVYDPFLYMPDTNSPALVNWSADEEDRVFYGYVTHTEHLPANPVEMVRVYMTGTSTPLNNPDPKSWTNVSTSFVAREVARRWGLRCVLNRSNRVVPFVASETGGDFSMMKRLAADEGYLFWVDGGTMYYLDPTNVVSLQNDQTVIQLWATSTDRSTSTVLELHRVTGPQSNQDGDAYTRVSYGIGPNNRLLKSTSTPPVSGLNTSPITKIGFASAGSQKDADLANAAAARNSTWAHLRAIVVGSPIFKIGKVANVDGPNVSRDLKGLWQIQGVTHVIARPNSKSPILQYTCELDLARNAPFTLAYNQHQKVDALSTTDAVLRNGTTWESSTMGAVYV